MQIEPVASTPQIDGTSRRQKKPQPEAAAEAPAAVGPEAGEGLPIVLTPMMKQYLEVKAQVPGAILFFRLGDFYEMFFEDAVKASGLLNITLTARSKGADKVPMCGVPHHSARRYIARLINFGCKVAICEQVEEAGGPGIVRREVVRVVTPGMVLDDDVLEATENNFLAALKPPTEDGESWGAVLLDASTGEFLALAPASLEVLGDELGRAKVRELLVPEGSLGPRLDSLLELLSAKPALATLPPDAFDVRRGEAQLKAHFQVASLDGYGLDPKSPSVGAACAALRYLKETQKTPAAHVDRISLLARGSQLVLDESCRTHLELLKTMKDGARPGSLLGVLDQTSTAAGARKLSRWISAPLAQVAAIDARLDAVALLLGKAVWREELGALLKQVADVERLCGRLSLASGTPRDLKGLGRSLVCLGQLGAAVGQGAGLPPLLKSLCGPLTSTQIQALGSTLESALLDEPPAVVAEGGFIRPGYDAELDGYVALATSGKDTLVKLEARERARTGIGSLKVRFNRVFGYYLEVTKANLHLVPKEWTRKQTMVGGERYATDELREYEEKVLSADEKRIALEQRLFEQLRALVVAQAFGLRAAADAAATLDVLISFARVSAAGRYVRPTIDESQVLQIEGGRHPVVEKSLPAGDVFVPNDVRLDREEAQLLVITGPNMAGKSTVMRQVALTVVMAQAGCFVPARAARIGLCDRVFTRVGASDNLARGQSTFMVEMTETAHILHHATRRSLVVLDEIGRGTSTFDGLSIAWAVAEQLHDRVGARTLFATHYHELTDLARERPRVKNCSIAVKEVEGRVLFLRKLVSGSASKSYGIEVARLAGLPPEVIARARELLHNLEASELDETGHPRLARRLPSANAAAPAIVDLSQLALFGPVAATVSGPKESVLRALEEFSLDASSPLEALNAIARWKAALGKKS
ncbi:MAG: mismatch repair protein MutS [Myxococcaceae bacterium]|nr:mismatch repair protein MutS [Myxococcaceae bacterium]